MSCDITPSSGTSCPQTKNLSRLMRSPVARITGTGAGSLPVTVPGVSRRWAAITRTNHGAERVKYSAAPACGFSCSPPCRRRHPGPAGARNSGFGTLKGDPRFVEPLKRNPACRFRNSPLNPLAGTKGLSPRAGGGRPLMGSCRSLPRLPRARGRAPPESGASPPRLSL